MILSFQCLARASDAGSQEVDAPTAWTVSATLTKLTSIDGCMNTSVNGPKTAALLQSHKRLVVVSTDSGQVLASVTPEKQGGIAGTAVAMGGPSGCMLASPLRNWRIRLWTLHAKQLECCGVCIGHSFPVRCLALAPQVPLLASGGALSILPVLSANL